MLGINNLLKMRGRINKGGVALFVMGVLAVALLPTALTKADTLTGTWTTGDAPVLALGEQVTAPTPDNCSQTSWLYHSYTNPNGTFNSIGRQLSTDVCFVENGLGQFGSINSGAGSHGSFEWIKPNTAIAFRVVNSTQQRALIPVPNQSAFVIPQTDGQSSVGSTTYRIFDRFSDAGHFQQVANQIIKELAFQVDLSIVAPLKDANGTTLQLRNHAFSNNGEWMVVEIQSFGFMRVNIKTKQMLLFTKDRFTYGLGFVPFVSLAISDDGNTVIQSGRKVYDLSGCQQVPFAYVGTNDLPGCRERAIHTILADQGIDHLDKMRFSADGLSVTGEAYDIPPSGTGPWTRYAMTFSVAGYQPTQLSYLALGDSFSSGEGAFAYAAGTDNSDNKCHLSVNSYPVITAGILNLTAEDAHNAACSEAMVEHYFNPKKNAQPQYPNRPQDAFSQTWFPGAEFQKSFVERATPEAITITMGGNDIGFSDKIVRCITLTDSCFHFKEDRDSIVYEIHNQFDRLVKLYNDIEADSRGARVYVLGYPNLFSTATTCGANVRFDQEERAMTRGLVGYLNAVIKAATQKAGVEYIDIEHVFAGHEHCDDAEIAVNGLTVGQEIANIIGAESYHPNIFGQQLMSQALLAQSQNLTKPMPVDNENDTDSDGGDATVTAPYIGSSAYNEFVNGAPTGGLFSRLTYSPLGVGEAVVKEISTQISVTDLLSLRPLASYQVWLHSTPIQLGTITTDAEGKLNGTITVPASVEPGFHTLHIVGPELAGSEQVDIYKTVYVVADANDLDGDGVTNAEEPCLVFEPAGVDADNDGIDDACDAEISQVPQDTTPPVVTGTPDREPNAAGWYNDDVIITWNSVDPEPSSGEPTLPAATVADQEGANIYTSDQSCDPANNCATGSVELSIDKTAPQIMLSTDPTPTDGWNLPGVVVSFECSDELSGIVSCSEPQTIFGADGSYQVVGVAVDAAGNVSQVSTTVQIDGTAPAPGAAEWTGNPKLTSATATINVPITETGSGIVEAEYFLGDTDPGVGNGATMQVNGSSASVVFGTDFPTGVYKVTVRAKDVVGNWSQTVSDYLVVYSNDGVRMTGKRFSLPSLTGGDALPGLLSDTQGDKAKFGFSVKFNDLGGLHANSDFQFSYQTGSKCNKPAQAVNCHNLEFNATSIGWLTTQGTNNSIGIFQGAGQLEVDDVITTVPFRVTGLDGERLSSTSADRIEIHLYPAGSSPFTATPQYHINAEVERGNIKIRAD